MNCKNTLIKSLVFPCLLMLHIWQFLHTVGGARWFVPRWAELRYEPFYVNTRW